MNHHYIFSRSKFLRNLKKKKGKGLSKHTLNILEDMERNTRYEFHTSQTQ